MVEVSFGSADAYRRLHWDSDKAQRPAWVSEQSVCPPNSSIHGQQGPPPARLQSCPSLSRGWLSLHVLVGVGMPANYLSCARQPLGAREFRFCKLHYDCREVPG